ncbi:hypothetical protein GBA52_020828 [Prunus armeniaca]|nr:hypothetical protein GBA52_020828 [Prunus armeniaca]
MSTVLRDGGEHPKYSDCDNFTLEIHHGRYVADEFYLGGTVHWSDNHCKDYVSMLDLYELAVKLRYTKKTKHTLESQAFVPSGATQGNKGKQHVVEHVDVGGEGFVDVDLETDDDGNVDGYRDDEEFVNYDQFGEAFVDDQFDEDVDVQDEEEDEEEPDVKDYVYSETEFEQSDEEDERIYGRFVVNEDEEDHEKELGEADIDDLRSVHDFEDEENTVVRGKTKKEPLDLSNIIRYHDLRFPKFSLGLEFPTMIEYREVVRYYANSCARLLKFVKNKPGRLRIKCNGKPEKGPCHWVLYASHVGKCLTIRVKTFVG